MTSRVQSIGRCNHCSRSFSYYLIHNGFNDSWYAYCDKCGKTSILSFFPRPKELQATILVQGVVPIEVVPFIRPCECGGVFLPKSSPRCPHCKQALSSAAATTWIEANASGSKMGWGWQQNWDGIYAIVIENAAVFENYLQRS